MTLSELLEWRARHRDLIQQFLHQHRELAGIHFMCDEHDRAWIEFAIKPWADPEDIEADVAALFSEVEWQIMVAEPPAE
ncbi:MAG: hypothetical protein D6691_03555 [Candidatus Hydrogenedentota bacterium]|jgi:hypothetical protein|uniref:Uncharacterized protein n=1 Tax=Sumerlaea chitinivorans TaxID=2250252 RepID=A0A2Z4Y4S9_SUMC1|nr:hypothetical protein BRCON_1111 [Candidatus Sumerlaea chitinivorans]RMH29074.1 MAG: hypothetical protein D6691_03555 [Candidatus Hydrogenedentota bacterium]GIX44150.1 MAG: hypothetical protein KatS3mg130_0558 [Candidatus Sumerlaea sp.]